MALQNFESGGFSIAAHLPQHVIDDGASADAVIIIIIISIGYTNNTFDIICDIFFALRTSSCQPSNIND